MNNVRLIPNTVPNVYAVDLDGACYPVAAWHQEDMTAYAIGPVGLFEADDEEHAIRVLPEVSPADLGRDITRDGTWPHGALRVPQS